MRRVIHAGGMPSGQSPHRICLKNFMFYGRSLTELVKIHAGLGEKIVAGVKIKGMEYYQKALDEGKSVLFISGHCGNWELMNLVLGHRLGPVSFVARRQNNPYITKLLEKIRFSYGNTILYKGGALEKIKQKLDLEGARVVILVDQQVFTNYGYKTIFLSRPTFSSRTPALMARKTHTAPLPVFMCWDGDHHKITIYPELALSDQADAEQAAIEDTQMFTTCISDFVKDHPEQWLWLADIWKPPKGRIKLKKW